MYKVSEKNKSILKHSQGGFYRPIHLRSRNYRNPNFNLELEKGDHLFYLKINTDSPVNIHLTLYKYKALISHITEELFLQALKL